MKKLSFREIERKFLVTGDYKASAFDAYPILQGYLSSVPGRNVRVRLCGDKAFLTVKGPSDPEGKSRFEWEKEISPEDARLLFPLCEPGMIEKIRYLVQAGRHVYEVDEFGGENVGLVIAEVELEEADESFIKPGWLGKEVTGDKRYYNSYLSKHPYKEWKND